LAKPLLAQLPLLLAACSAECRSAPGDSGAPLPWEQLEALELEPFRELARTELPLAQAPLRLTLVERPPLVLVSDPLAGGVHVADERFRHDPRAWCVDASAWDWEQDGLDRRGDCDEGLVQVQRGWLEPQAAALAATADQDSLDVFVLDADGLLSVASTHPQLAHPLDSLRLQEGPQLEGLAARLAAAPDATVLLAVEGQERWVALGECLLAFDDDGSLLQEIALPGVATDLVLTGGAPWAAAGEALWADGAVIDLQAACQRLTPDGVGGVWASLPDAGLALQLDADGQQQRQVAAQGMTGPLAWDAGAQRLYLAVDDGVLAADPGAADTGLASALYELDSPADLAVSGSHEILLLDSAGELAVYGDDSAMGHAAPLHVMTVAFAENPKTRDEQIPCRGDETSMQGLLETAQGNRAFMDDLPGAQALGITPAAARMVAQCGQVDAFRQVWDAPRSEPGLLFHDQPDGCEGDEDCYLGFLTEEVATLALHGINSTWASGIAPHYDEGYDWVAGLAQAEFTSRFLFFGMSVLPEISGDDPRSKDPYPWEGGAAPRAWLVASAAAISEPVQEGTMALYPGNNRPAFQVGACPNLAVKECNQLGQGGGASFDEQDMLVLDLLLRRAIAQRSDSGPDSWTYHLPAIGVYDYTEGCSASERLWSGEGCEAALLQSWLMQVHQRYVLNDLASWTLPSELPLPQEPGD